MSNLFYEVLSISFFLPQQVSRIEIDFCGILLPSSTHCKAGKRTLHLGFDQPFFSIKEPIVLVICCFPQIAGHLLRVSFTPGLRAKVKSRRRVVFNLLSIPGNPGATSRDDAIFSGESLLQELESPWELTLTEPVPEMVEFSRVTLSPSYTKQFSSSIDLVAWPPVTTRRLSWRVSEKNIQRSRGNRKP